MGLSVHFTYFFITIICIYLSMDFQLWHGYALEIKKNLIGFKIFVYQAKLYSQTNCEPKNYFTCTIIYRTYLFILLSEHFHITELFTQALFGEVYGISMDSLSFIYVINVAIPQIDGGKIEGN